MRRFLAIAAKPVAYVIGFALLGMASIVCGISVLFGFGWALIALGIFLIASAAYITKGLTPNG